MYLDNPCFQLDCNMHTHTPCFRLSAFRLGVWLIFAVFIAGQYGQAIAADDATPRTSQEERQEIVTESKDKGTTCVHGCMRWGKFCNVDPRGVYKCRRRCEKFGEICE